VNVSVVIATSGELKWHDLAWSRAYPSAVAQAPVPETVEIWAGSPEQVVGVERELVPFAVEIVIEHHAMLSVSRARNAAARSASGDWLCFLDADDELEPGYLVAMAEANRGTIYPAVEPPWTTAPPPLFVPNVRRIWPDCSQEGPGIPNLGKWPILNECVIGTLISRRLFDEIGGFRDFASLEDYDLFLRAYDAGAALVYVDGAVYRECVNPGGRNRDQSTRAAIWADHEARVKA
jgi:GT2 family glycosyltransferase